MIKKEQSGNLTPVFKVAIAIFGIVLIIIVYQTIQLWKIRHSWISTTGIVVKTASRGWWDEKKQWRYYLKYQYKVKGKKYTNVRFHIKERSIKKYTYLLRNLRKGDPIKVWYNPKYPDQAVINTDYLRNGFILIALFTGFIVMAGTMILKENRWKRQSLNLTAAAGPNYNGEKPLMSSEILNDQGNILTFDTGMSVFWSFGIPFFFFSFLSVFFMLISLKEINPGWTFLNYWSLIALGWAGSLIGSFFIKKGFAHTLEINAIDKIIKEISVQFFRPIETKYNFSDIHEVKLYKDVWRPTNFLRNWILFLHTRSHKSLFISFRHRDIQPALSDYLDLVKRRIEYLVFEGGK